MKLPQILALTLLAACLSCGAAFADLFSVTVEQVGDDVWDYTLYNNDVTGNIRVIEFNLVWDELESPGPAIVIVGSPVQGTWINDTDGESYAWWANLAGGSEEHPLPGESLSGFRVQSSTYLPVFYVGYYNIEDPLEWLYTDYQQVVPEPTSLATLGAATACLLPAIRKRRVR